MDLFDLASVFRAENVFSVSFFFFVIFTARLIDNRIMPMVSDILIPEFVKYKRELLELSKENNKIMSIIAETQKQIAVNQGYVLHEIAELKSLVAEKSFWPW